ncbi:MAG: GDSL-type esterase/lipase family protein [Candidatus Baltobacteraceae bacterium]
MRSAAPRLGEIAFIGDSLTEGWEAAGIEVWESRFAQRGAVNFGVGGDLTGDVLWRVEHGELDGLALRLIVLLVGTNDLGSGLSPAATFRGIAATVRALAARFPEAHVLLLGILPRGSGGPLSPMRRSVAAVNASLTCLDDGKRVHFLDIGGAFLEPGGAVRPEMFEADKVHLAAPGYRAWADAMGDAFNALL